MVKELLDRSDRMLTHLLTDPESDFLRFIPIFEMYFLLLERQLKNWRAEKVKIKPRMTDLGTASPLSFENYFSPTIIPKGKQHPYN